MGEILGIHQSDLIIESAINIALQRLRDNPELIDDIFASLRVDETTKGEYGDSYIARAKAWFLKTETPVFMSYRLDGPKLPCISIGLQESTEAEQTHGDVHYVPEELTEANWPMLAGPFNPVDYVPSSGIVVLPPEVVSSVVVSTGMWLVDTAGREYQIIEILDDDTVAITVDTVAEFRANTYLKGSKPRLISKIESVNFRETYVIGCHVQNGSTFLTFLHSIVLYSLMKYKQELLEARGLERTSLSSSDFRRNDLFENEIVYSRAIILNGFVRQSWRKSTDQRLESVTSQVEASVEDEAGVPVYEDGEINVEALAFEDATVAESD
jgi:hypothetical protein